MSREAGGRRVEGARRLFLSAAVVAVFGTFGLHGLLGAIDASAASFQSGPGRVSVSSRPQRPMFDLRELAPGDAARAFQQVTYDGDVPGEVRLFADVDDQGLARHLSVTVTRGSGRGASFVPDPNGLLYTGPLSAFPTGWADGLSGGAPWDAGHRAAFRFEVRLSEDAPGGAAAEASFAWEARPA